MHRLNDSGNEHRSHLRSAANAAARVRRFPVVADPHWIAGAVPLALAVALFFAGELMITGFVSVANGRSLLTLASFLGLASIGQTLAILVGGIDLSIPAVIGMANVLLANLYSSGVPIWVCILIVLAIGGAVGAFNALAAQLLHAHSLIVTLGTGTIVTGATLAYTSGFNSTFAQLPAWLTDAAIPIGRTGPIPIPAVVIIWLALAVLVVALERRSRLGRLVYTVGSNSVAARFAGVRPLSVWVAVFSLSGLLAAGTGVLLAGFSGGSDVYVGSPYLFLTVTAVVVGGTPLVGGRGGYGRTVGGVLLITVLTTLLIGLGLREVVQQMLLGVLIVAAASLYGREPDVRYQV